MKHPILLGVNTFCNLNIRYELWYVLYDFIHFLGNFPILLHYVVEKISSIVQRWLAEGSQAKYLWLTEWKPLIE